MTATTPQLPESEHLALDLPAQGILRVTMSRPDRLNALTLQMFSDITTLCRAIGRRSDIRAVVLTGAGRGFSAGLDLDALSEIGDMSPTEFLTSQEVWAEAAVALRQLPTPVVAAVNGPAAGAGFSLAMACDIRIASTQARFNAAFIRVGLSGGDLGSSWLLPRIVGLGVATEILMSGRSVSADEAFRIGLANRVAAPEELMNVTMGVCESIVANSPFGVRLTKQVIQSNLGAASMEHAVALENRNQTLAVASNDHKEALSAFRLGRSPRFGGR